MRRFALVSLLLFGCGATPPQMPPPAGDEPAVELGWDAYRHLERWPSLRLRTRTYLRSTYDRSGGNADANGYLRQLTPTANVNLDVAGAGVLAFFRANHWHGSPWHWLADGNDIVVEESSTADPTHPVPNPAMLPADVFPAEVAPTWPITQGADLSWVPVGFSSSFQIQYERQFYPTGYFIYSLYAPNDTTLASPPGAWTGAAPPDDVRALFANAGSDLAPTGDGVTTLTGTADVAANQSATLLDSDGRASIRLVRFTVPLAQADAFSAARLRITWEGRSVPSVDAPMPLFFGAGTLYNRNHVADLVKAIPVNIHFDADKIILSAYFPMPYYHHAKVELVAAQPLSSIGWELRSDGSEDPAGWAGWFHASYRDHGTPVAGQDLVFLDTNGEEGASDWCGHFIGTSFIFSDRANLGTLEGDPRFFFDDSQTPQAQGTGTEEWGGGGDYWQGGLVSTLPLAGHPVGATSPQAADNAADQIESAYRFLIADEMPFGKNARIQLEHGGVDESTEHYQSVTYWYGLPGACLVATDSLHVGDDSDEAAHRYLSPDASPVDMLTSRYEWGVDHLNGVEIYPASTDTGRHTTGTSEFSLAIDPANHGVLLRRKLDYSFADQRAEVFVADDADGAPFVDVGTWYLAGSSTWLGISAPSETGVATPQTLTSNRQWRDDEFILPRSVTGGRDHIRVRVQSMPLGLPLLPGASSPPQAWSEYRYTAYSWVMPPLP